MSKERILEKVFFINDIPFVMEAKRIAEQMQMELKMGSLTIVESNGKVLTQKVEDIRKEENEKRKAYVV